MELVVIGQGGHSKVIRDLVQSCPSIRVVAYLDDKYKTETLNRDERLCMGPISMARKLWEINEQLKFVVAIGDNTTRERIVSGLDLPDECYVSLIHVTAVVSPSARIGFGSVVMARAVVNAEAVVGNHAIINTGAVIEHDSGLGDYVHISPQATLTGAVQVREGAMIGAGATVIPRKTIGEWATVGAGATVITNIPAYATAVGNPARVIRTSSGKVVTQQCSR